MNQTLPDWMFAAFAIGAWLLGGWVNRNFHWPVARWIAGGIVVVCALTIGVRYLIRFIRRLRQTETEDPDEWKRY